jgi:hypothetical protein
VYLHALVVGQVDAAEFKLQLERPRGDLLLGRQPFKRAIA